MQSKIRLLPLALSCALAVALAGCQSKDTDWVMQYGEEKIPAGIYLYNMIGAYSEASYLAPDPNEDPIKQQVEGQDAAAWITEKAQQYTREYIATEKQFADRSLALGEEEQEYITQMVDYQWQYLEKSYTDNGISKESVEKTIANAMKQNVLFENIYGPEGSEPVPEADLLEKYQSDYTRSIYIALQKKDQSGQPLPEEELTKNREEIEGYYSRAVKGEAFEDIVYDYERAHTPEDQEVTKRAEGSSDAVIARTGSSFPPKYIEEVFKAPIGTPVQAEDEDYFYLILRRELMGNGEDFEQKKYSLLSTLKGEEFRQRLADWAKEMAEEVTVNDAALKRYTPDKLKFEQ